jgi:hypothetical protein
VIIKNIVDVISIKKINDRNAAIDFKAIRAGVYFVMIQTKQGAMVEKLQLWK